MGTGCKRVIYCFYLRPASVSIRAVLGVAEESGAVSVCATLAITPAIATTSRDISVTLATIDGTGESVVEEHAQIILVFLFQLLLAQTIQQWHL